MKKQLFVLLNLICIHSGYLFSMEKSQGSNLKKFEPLLSKTAPKNGSQQRLLAILAVRALDFESVNIPTVSPKTPSNQ